MCVLLVTYHLILEKEKMHQFKRFYLLFSIVFSFVISFITIEVIQKSSKQIGEPLIFKGLANGTIIKERIDYTPIILWCLYSLGALMMVIRFGKNIYKIIQKAKTNKALEYKNAKLVLLKEKILPHTFLNTIFINEEDYNTRNIEKELYTHELTHVTQKHTIDILII
jgi:hypothetical protein